MPLGKSGKAVVESGTDGLEITHKEEMEKHHHKQARNAGDDVSLLSLESGPLTPEQRIMKRAELRRLKQEQVCGFVDV